jgi:glucose-6-phosphate isomerase
VHGGEAVVDRISIDIGRCKSSALGGGILEPGLLSEFEPRLESARQAVLAKKGTGMLGWTELPAKDPKPYLDFAAAQAGKFDQLLIVGIGGSALGTIALSTSLLPIRWNELTSAERQGRPRLYVLDNVDPDETAGMLDLLDLKRTLVNVISKSGTTAETMASYLVVRERLEAAVGASALKDHLVFTTDPDEGTLRALGETMGVPTFELPDGVGGRFSVLSSVGLAPAALLGIDVRTLLAGAADMAETIGATTAWDNPACLFAGVHYLEDTVYGRRVCVMMPYSARLRDVSDWYRQLWAESLGKSVDRQGRRVTVGPLPVKALGVTDQHSQLQLYAEGPDDKVITFLGVGDFAQTVMIPEPGAGAGAEALGYLSGHTLAELMWAEQKATAWALAQKGRPSLTITLPRVDAFSIGSLLYMLQMATAVAGELYDVDAFDQPGVELSKKATYALMGRPGYEQLAKDID